jgi:hypothetical protein
MTTVGEFGKPNLSVEGRSLRAEIFGWVRQHKMRMLRPYRVSEDMNKA